jgi:penicillin G amidase
MSYSGYDSREARPLRNVRPGTAMEKSFLPRLVRGCFVAACIAIAAAAAGQQPNVASETMSVAGLKTPVEILVDRWGVPHIYAKNEADLFFAQGFNAARDRLFQIDLWRRRGLGQLSEVFGPAFVEQDKATRLFLYRGDMKKEWASYSRDAEEIAGHFVAGINAYIDWLANHPERMPYEFKKLEYRPAKWAAEDVVRIRSHGLTGNLTSEVSRANVACAAGLSADEIRIRLQPAWQTQIPEGLDPCLPQDVIRLFILAQQEVRLTREAMAAANPAAIQPAPIERSEGSNNWVIAPSRSTTGRAVMANDPHRAYTEPSVRYIVDLNAPTLHAIGANEAAVPGISLGHNDWIAFGYTRFYIDQEDLYVYELNPANPDQYKYQGAWETFRTIKEEIKIKGRPAMPVELKFTRHGPVAYVEKEKNRAFAVRSAWLEAGTSPYSNALRHMRARTFEEFKQSIGNWGAPGLNHVYADSKGNIGWIAGGFAPIRPNWDGLMPVPGDGRYEWAGRWSGEQLPSLYNPASGYITTSNEMNIPAGYPVQERKLGFEWVNGSRHQRLEEILSKPGKFTIEDSLRMQNDEVSIPARRLAALLQPLTSNDPKTQLALNLLKGWDGVIEAGLPQSALHEVWWSRYLGKAFKAAVLTKAGNDAIPAPDAAVMLDTLENPRARFGENAEQKRDQLLLTSLRSAYEEMEKLQGTDPRQWNWGKLHYNLSEHPFAAIVDDATRARLNVGPIELRGSEFVPNNSQYRASDFRQMNGPSVRVVVDVGNWDNSRAINHPGQSGDPDSPHYRDLAPMWRNGEYFPLLYSRKAVEDATEKRITLVPAQGPR